MSTGTLRRLAALGFAAFFGWAGVAPQAGPTLDEVKQAGPIDCGVRTGGAGFAQPDRQGISSGFKLYICKAVAAALFDAANKVKLTPLTRASPVKPMSSPPRCISAFAFSCRATAGCSNTI